MKPRRTVFTTQQLDDDRLYHLESEYRSDPDYVYVDAGPDRWFYFHRDLVEDREQSIVRQLALKELAANMEAYLTRHDELKNRRTA